MKETEYNNITEEEVAKLIHKERDKILEEFTKAYLAETQLMPSEIQLVCKTFTEDGKMVTEYEFRRKKESE